jgi:hypothetical protein
MSRNYLLIWKRILFWNIIICDRSYKKKFCKKNFQIKWMYYLVRLYEKHNRVNTINRPVTGTGSSSILEKQRREGIHFRPLWSLYLVKESVQELWLYGEFYFIRRDLSNVKVSISCDELFLRIVRGGKRVSHNVSGKNRVFSSDIFFSIISFYFSSIIECENIWVPLRNKL